MMNQPLACAERTLYTTVRNLSDVEKFFGFLPPNGRSLGAGEEFAFLGNLENYIIEDGVVNDRKRQSLERAITTWTDDEGTEHDPVLAIVTTPAVHIYDVIRDETMVLKLSNGSVGVQDPACGVYSSSLFGNI